MSITATSTNGDAVAVYLQQQNLPIYFELAASVSVVKPTAGWKANAYLIFDYQSPTDWMWRRTSS